MVGNLISQARGVNALEQAFPGAEQDWRNGQMHLVDKSGGKILPHGGNPAAEPDILTMRSLDSSFQRGVPASFQLGGLIPAWVEAIQLMRPGDEWVLFVPPAQGYGDQDQGEIPPNSVLIFRIQLLGVLQHPAAMG